MANAKGLRWMGAVLGISAVAAAVIGVRATSTAAAPGPAASAQAAGKALARPETRAWQPGSFLRYALTMSSQLSVGASDQLLMGIDVKGNWEWTVISASPSGQVIHAQLRDVSVNVQTGQQLHQPSLDKLKAELQQSTFIEVDPTGRVKSVAFSQSAQGFSLHFLEALIDSTELAQSPKGGDSWQAEETDTTGRYLAAYARLPSGAFRKQKLKYLSVVSGGAEQPDWKADVKDSRADFSVAGGALSHLDSKEVVSTSAPGALGSGTATTSITLSLLTREARPSAVAQLGTARATARPAAALELPDDRSVADQAVVRGRSLEALVKDAKGYPEQEENARRTWADARRALAALLRLSPEAVAEAAKRVRSQASEVDPLTTSLGDAGTPQAQSALVALAGDGKLPASTRNAALDGLARAARPEPDALQALLAALEVPALEQQAAVDLGQAIRNLRPVDPNRARDVTGSLTTRLAATKEASKRRLYLAALGNAAEPSTVAVLLASTQSTDATERWAAVSSLHGLPGAAVDDALAKMALEGKTANDRSSAVTAIRGRAASDPLFKAVSTLARTEKEQSIRIEAIRALIDFMPALPAARDELSWVVEHEPNDSYKAIAKHALEKR